MLPFRSESDVDLAAVRDLFIACGYTAPRVCERGGVDTIYQFEAIGRGRETGTEIDDALDVLIRLFLDGLPVEAARVEELLPPRGLEALRAVGLVDRHPAHPGAYAASVLLYPTESLYVASDLDPISPGLATPEELERPDHVFAAITTLTGTFVGQLPTTPCARFLELCSGTGIAALMASRSAEQVWALDITERSTRFAEFNARLNGIDNFTALRGDLFEPVAGMTFDRIVAHPPYVPAKQMRFIYRDAGEDGEQVLRRILADLPDHLSPGGHFYCTCTATDRLGAPLEERIREMLGERGGDFDILLVEHYAMHPTEYYSRHAASGRIAFAAVEQYHELYRSMQAERIVYCSMVLQRHASPRAPFTLRRERTERAGGPEADWLLRWSTLAAEGDELLRGLLDAKPRLSEHARLEVVHQPVNGEWSVAESRVRVAHPYVRAVDLSLNAAMLLALFDGSLTTREILDRVRGAGAVAGEVPDEAFAQWVRELVTEGVLELDALPRSGARKPAVRHPANR